MLDVRLVPVTGPWGNFLHLRHFQDAVCCHPDLRFVADASSAVRVDFSIGRYCRDLPPAVLNAVSHVLVLRNDPHSMAYDFDVGQLILPWMREWQQLAGYGAVPQFRDFGAYMRAHTSPDSFRPILDQYDIVAVPFLDCYAPAQLQHAQLLRVHVSVPDTVFYTTLAESRFIDVFFLGEVGEYYPLRAIALKHLHELCAAWPKTQSNIKFWHAPMHATPRGISWLPPDEFDAQQQWYANCLRHAKMTIFEGGIFNYPVAKYVEAMACGCLVLAPIPREGQILGFVDGVTMVAVDPFDYMDKIEFYRTHDDARLAIVSRAANLVRKYYTCAASAARFVQQLHAAKAGEAVSNLNSALACDIANWLADTSRG